MLPPRTTFTLIIVMISLLLISGCTDQTGSAQQTTIVPMESPSTIVSQTTVVPQESTPLTTPSVLLKDPTLYKEPLVDIDTFTEFIVVSSGSMDELQSVNALNGREYTIPGGITKFDVVTFHNAALYKKINDDSAINLKIRGKLYQSPLTRMHFGTDNGIYSYTGSLTGQPGSDILVTVATDSFIGSIRLGNETFFIEPIETFKSASAHSASLNIVYSSADVKAGRPMCIDSCPTTA